MRIIKFRVWNKKEKKMFYEPYSMYKITKINDVFKSKKYHEWMQFTNLKDKKGKEIYEGDILGYRDTIESSNDPSPDRRIVVRDKDTGQLTHAYVDGNTRVSGLSWCKANAKKCFEIIGNIYENKELLK